MYVCMLSRFVSALRGATRDCTLFGVAPRDLRGGTRDLRVAALDGVFNVMCLCVCVFVRLCVCASVYV